MKTWIEIFVTSLKLGLTSFGGPVAHLGYFRAEYVEKKRWLDDKTYADLIALCNFLPGPASSQVGISIGYLRGGVVGSILSWIGFTFPSVFVLVLFALFLQSSGSSDFGWVHGLKLVAVAVVAHAIWGMGGKLIQDNIQRVIFLVSTTLVLVFPTALGQVGTILLAGIVGYAVYRKEKVQSVEPLKGHFSKKIGIISWILFFGLLIGLPVVHYLMPSTWTTLADVFYRTGSLVFGGGHVVLPLLEAEFVETGLLTANEFLAGYGVTQAVPGPLFTFAGYIGTIMTGVIGGLIATFFMFLPSFLLVFGTLPFWKTLREKAYFQAGLKGVNAAVVGLLFAALYNPVWTSAVGSALDFVVVVFAFMCLQVWKVAPWKVVGITALLGWVITLF